MRKRLFKRSIVVAAVASLGATVFPATPARAQTVYEVEIASFLSGGGGPLPAESMRFFPNTINVHKGDILHFTTESFHTATLLPVGQVPEAWIGANAGSTSAPWAIFVKDPDEGANGLKINNRVAFGPQDCGAPTAPCGFDGRGTAVDGVLNSGLPLGGPLDFSVEIKANAGETIWALCLVHAHMRMRINVVADATAATTQAEIDASQDQRTAFDADWAAATHNKLKRKRSSHATASGGRVWDVNVGYDNHWASLFAMYPRKLRIKKGDTVRFHFDGLIYETHTATFGPLPGQDGEDPLITVVCDPDGDTGTSPDTPPTQPGPPFCANPAQLELDARPDTTIEQGDGRFGGGDAGTLGSEGSGLRGAELWASSAPLAGNASWDVTFPKASGDKGFRYFCVLHPFMVGKIFVE